MHNDDLHSEETASTGAGISRRSVVKTGAHMAWAVPAVTLATSAPALAVSGGTVKLQCEKFDADYVKVKKGKGKGAKTSTDYSQADVTLDGVRNRGNGDGGQVIVIVSLQAKGPFEDKAVPTNNSGARWTFVGKEQRGNKWLFTFTSNRDLGPKEEIGALKFNVQGKDVKKSKSIALTCVAHATGDNDAANPAVLPAFQQKG